MLCSTTAGPIKLELKEVGGAWLVSSGARLATVPGCYRSLVGALAESACWSSTSAIKSQRGLLELPIPPAVKQAGGREQREFEAGKLVVAQSGCLACHRIGDNGNRGPGSNLTHIGAKLSEREIAHALVDSRAPMPSFSRLPAQKSHDIVRFLALLR